MTFYFTIEHDRKTYRLKAERIFLDKVHEEYRIYTSTRSFVLQSNRPNFRNRGLKHIKGSWRVVEGTVKNHYMINKVIEVLSKEVEKYPLT